MRFGRVRLATLGMVLLVVVVAAVSWFAVLAPRLATASEIRTQATQVQTANLSLRNQYNQALDQAQEAPQAAAEAQQLFARMPQTAELPTILEQITAAATAAGIDPNAVATLTTGVPVPVPAAEGSATGINLATMDVGVTAVGTRPQVLAFLDNLQGLDRSLLVTSTLDSAVPQVAGESRGPALESIQVGGQMFVLESKLPDLVATVESLLEQANG